jgi:hypothetical protein
MKDCSKCGANNWTWKCEGGLMQGTCGQCGEKTNRFKANGKRQTLDGKRENKN